MINSFKYKTAIAIISFLILSGIANAQQNTMWIDTLAANPNDTATFSVKIRNSQKFVAFQLDIQFPSNLTYINNSAALTSRANGHSISTSLIAPDRLRVLAFSMSNNQFNDSIGAVLTFKGKAGSLPGTNPVTIYSPLIVDSNNVNILTGYFNGRFTLNAPNININPNNLNMGRTPMGVPLNSQVYISNTGTINLIVSKIYTTSTEIIFTDTTGFTLTPGNGVYRTVRLLSTVRGIKTGNLMFKSNDPDDTLHVSSVTGNVYSINEIYLSSNTANAGTNTNIKVRMKNYDPITAFEFSVQLPSTFNYVAGSVILDSIRKKDHQISASVLPGNVLKIISFSPSNNTYSSNDSTVARFTLNVTGSPGSYSLPVSNGVLSDTNGVNVLSDAFAGSVLIKTPVIIVSSALSFDSVSYLDTARKQLTIQNTGNDTLIISSAACTSGNFVNETTLPLRILPGNSSSLTLRFSSTVRGINTGTLTINHNDIMHNPSNVNLSAFVYKPNRLLVLSPDFNSRDTSYIPFGINNTEPFVAFQFDVTLPPQALFQGNTILLGSRADGHQVFANVLPNGDIRVIAYSANQLPFSGTTGEVVKFKVAMNADTGIYNVALKNVIISDSANIDISSGYNNGFIRVNPYPPNLVSPLDGSVGNQVNLNLLWRRSPFASKYHLQLATDSLFANKIVNDSTMTDTLKYISNLTPLSFYYWRIRIKNYSGISMFTNPWKFKTIGYPTQSALVYPPNDTINMPVNVTFQWWKATDQLINDPLTVNKYWFELSTDSLFSNITSRDSTLSDTLKTISGLLNDTKYYWHIKAKNEIGWGNFSQFNRFTTIVPLPVAPVLISPSDNSVGNQLSLNLIWNRPAYSPNFYLQFASDSLFQNLIVNDSTLTDTVKNISVLTVLTNYWWRVKSRNIAGSSSFTSPFKFRTIGTPTQVSLSYPVNNAVNIPVSLSFIWTKAIDQTSKTPRFVSNYWFELSADSLFSNVILRDSTVSDTLKSASGLNNITNYWWRVKALNEVGWGAFSSIWKFTTIVPAPVAPVLVSPDNNSTGLQLSLNFNWTKPQYATGYNYQLSTDSLFNNLVINDSLLTDSIKAVSGLSGLTNYWWRVKSLNIGGVSSFSTVWKFKTLGVPTQVYLLNPINNSVNQPVSLTFNWTKAYDQTFKVKVKSNKNSTDDLLYVNKYWFEIAADSLFNNIAVRDTSLADTLKTVGDLLNDKRYYWRVKAKNEIGWGDFSSFWNFTTIIPLPNAPAQVSPLNNSTGNQLSLNLIWRKVQYGTNYHIQLASDSNFTALIINDSTLTDSVKSVSGLNPLTNYWWRVRAKNFTGNGVYSSVWKFKTIGIPTQVSLSSPANNATGQPVNLTFKWFKAVDQVFNLLSSNGNSNKGEETDNPNAVSNYWFELATDSLFTSGVTRDSLLTDTTKSVTSLLNFTNYYWRVKAKNQIGWAAFSSFWKFTTIVSIPVAPVLLLPANNSTGVSLAPLLDWNDVQYSASYRIQVSTDQLFNTILWDTSGVVPSQVNIPANKLTGLTQYYWRVNATNAGGTGPYSAVWNFRTLQNLTLNLKVYLEGFWNGSTQVSDTTMVYLANSTSPYAFVDSAKIVFTNSGTSLLNFTKAPNASYYIVINHRNHLETWSKLPQSFVTNVAVNYDFTTSANKAFGDNMKQVGSVWVLYGGDANRDGSVDALDVFIFIGQFGNSGYLSCDFNGDESVDALDVPILIANFGLGKAVPTLDVQLPGNIRKEKVIEEIQKRFKLNGESDKKETFKKTLF